MCIRDREIDLEKRVMLFLFARLMNRSNRDVEELLEFFEPLFGFKVSYKTIDRKTVLQMKNSSSLCTTSSFSC